MHGISKWNIITTVIPSHKKGAQLTLLITHGWKFPIPISKWIGYEAGNLLYLFYNLNGQFYWIGRKVCKSFFDFGLQVFTLMEITKWIESVYGTSPSLKYDLGGLVIGNLCLMQCMTPLSYHATFWTKSRQSFTYCSELI